MFETTARPTRPHDGDGPPDESGRGGRERELRFVRRIHRLRTLGLGLGSLCVGSVLLLHDEPWFVWVALAANGLLWPHVAFVLASRGAHPKRSELRHLMLDSAFGGVWVALMQFNLLPSVLLVTMLAADKLAAAGMRFMLRTTAVLAGACVLTSAALGFAVDIHTPMSVVVACVPFLFAYPLAISKVMHELSNRVLLQNRTLSLLSATDELTGLANRRHGLAAAEHELARHRRDGAPAVLVVVDIDVFKAINDRYGHPAGDHVLRSVATMLRQCSRATDTVARYAGDEFLLLMRGTTVNGAEELAARIRSRLAAATFEHAPGLRCTVSLGAAEVHREMADVEDWVQQADAALYRAKREGRDRLMCAPTIESARGSARGNADALACHAIAAKEDRDRCEAG